MHNYLVLCRRTLGVLLGVVMFGATSLPAVAAEPEQEDGADGAAKRPWMLATGIGLAETPRYIGSDHTKLRMIPYIKASYQTDIGRFSLGGENGGPGLSWSISPDRNSELGLLLGHDRGRKESDDSNLAGLGDIKSSFEYGAFAAYRFGHLKLQSTLMKGASSGHGGILANLKAEYEYPLGATLSLNSGLGVDWASDTYMQRYFGINAQQSTNSGLRSYSAKAGVRDVRASLGLMWRPAPHWMLMAQAGVKWLEGDAADSPIVKKRTQPQLVSGVAYLW